MQNSDVSIDLGVGGVGDFGAKSVGELKLKNLYRIECLDANGNVKWVEEFENLITTVGATDLLSNYFKGSSYTAAWYVGLFGGVGTIAATDTMSSHAGWTDFTSFSNANRPTLTLGAPSAGSVDNSASQAVFNINASGTILGAYVVNNNTVGGTTGTLYGAGSFSSSRSVQAFDTLNTTITLQAS